MTMLQRRILLLLSLLCIKITTTTAISKLLLDSRQNKCVTTTAPMGTILMVHYEAPDLILDETNEYYGPVHLNINVIPSKRMIDFENNLKEEEKKSRTQEILQDTVGVVSHMIQEEGFAIVCIRATMASNKNPMRFGLFVDRNDDPSSLLYALTEEQQLDGHLSHMETELETIRKALKTLVADTEYEKQTDANVHQEMKSMHAATIFWPVIQVCVLLLTGFTQVSHITNFFQTHRII